MSQVSCRFSLGGVRVPQQQAMFRRLLPHLRSRATKPADVNEGFPRRAMNLNTPERLRYCLAKRFIEVAKPDPDTGCSRLVDYSDHPEFRSSNGSQWTRGDIVRIENEAWAVQKKRANDTPTGKIVAMRCVGHADVPVSRSVPQDVRQSFKGISCVETGAKSDVEIDHKNGRYNATARAVADFQPLCRASNIRKRSACAECKRTGLRFDATRLHYPAPWLEGGEEFGDGNVDDVTGCNGCYYHDIARFKREISYLVLAAESASVTADEAGSITHTPARMRSINYLGAKTKLLPSLLNCFDTVRAASRLPYAPNAVDVEECFGVLAHTVVSLRLCSALVV